jgi:drug/metabolite transporter (DMT)-like permease
VELHRRSTLALAIYTIPLVALAGAPMYFLLRRFGRLTPAFFIGAGALVGLAVGVQVGFKAHSWVFGLLFVLNGAISAAVAYAVLRRLARPPSNPLVNRR